jgi:hypothetical protein
MASSRPGLTQAHRDEVAWLVSQGASYKDFTASSVDAGLPRPKGFVPDAFHFDSDKRVATLYEVVVSNAIASRKWPRLRAWRDELLAAGWSLRVLEVVLCNPAEVDLDTEGVARHELLRAVRSLDGQPCERTPLFP